MLRHMAVVIENHWNFMGFIEILKYWTNHEFKKAWNSCGFSTKMLRHTNVPLQKVLYFLHDFNIFEIIKSFLLKIPLVFIAKVSHDTADGKVRVWNSQAVLLSI